MATEEIPLLTAEKKDSVGYQYLRQRHHFANPSSSSKTFRMISNANGFMFLSISQLNTVRYKKIYNNTYCAIEANTFLLLKFSHAIRFQGISQSDTEITIKFIW